MTSLQRRRQEKEERECCGELLVTWLFESLLALDLGAEPERCPDFEFRFESVSWTVHVYGPGRAIRGYIPTAVRGRFKPNPVLKLVGESPEAAIHYRTSRVLVGLIGMSKADQKLKQIRESYGLTKPRKILSEGLT